MKDKAKLFLEAGAKEVWIITEDGQTTYYDFKGQKNESIFDIDLTTLV